jgi:hypothetical protein
VEAVHGGLDRRLTLQSRFGHNQSQHKPHKNLQPAVKIKQQIVSLFFVHSDCHHSKTFYMLDFINFYVPRDKNRAI